MVTKELSAIETISVVEAGRRIGISRPLAYRLAREGKTIPVIRLGKRRYVVPLAAFNRWLENAGKTGSGQTD
jgi:excisionase family DNA binding protein